MELGEGVRDAATKWVWGWPLPGGRRTGGEVARVCTRSGFDALSLGASLALLPLCARTLRLEGSLPGLEVPASAIGIVLLACLAGCVTPALSQRLGRRAVLVGAGLCRGLALASAALVPSFAWLWASGALFAVGAGSPLIAADSLAEAAPPEQHLAGGAWLMGAVCLGLAAGANLGVALSGLDPRVALALGAVVCFGSVCWTVAGPPAPALELARRVDRSAP